MFLAFLISLLAFAPTESSDDPDYFELTLTELLNMKITTASLDAETLTEAPGVSIVVTSRDIAERGYQHLEDLLADLPGVDVNSRISSVTRSQVTFRGVLGNNKLVILKDGVRMSSPTGDPTPIAENYPLHNVKQVEVIYGPASALYGADAFVGVVNMITYGVDDEVQDRVRIAFGAGSERRANFLKIFNWGEEHGLVISGSMHEEDGLDLTDDYPEDLALGDLITFGGQLAIAQEDRVGWSTPGSSATLDLKYQKDKLFLGYRTSKYDNSTNLGVRANAVDFAKDAQWHTHLDSIYATYDFEIGKGLKSQFLAAHANYEVDPQTRFANIFVDFNEGFKYALGTKTEFAQLFRWKLGSKTKMIARYNWERYHAIPKTADLPKPFERGEAINTQGLEYPGSDLPIQIFEVNYEAYGLMAQAQTRWSEKLISTVGLRYDHSSNYGSTTNPRLGLVYLRSDKTTFKALYGEAYIAPSPRASYEHFGSFAFQREDGLYHSFYFYLPNPDLEPEKIRTLELHGMHHISERASVSLSLFQERADNLLWTETPEPDHDFVPGGFIEFTQRNANLGELDTQGGELRLLLQYNTWNAWLHYSHVDGDITGPDGELPLNFIAKHKLKFGGTWRTGNFFLTPSLHHIGSMLANNIDIKVPAYTVANLNAGWNPTRRLGFSLNVQNIADEKYYHPGSGGAGAMDLVPAYTRTMRFSGSYRF